MKVFASLVVASLLVGLLGVCAYLYGENCEQSDRLDALEMSAVRQADLLRKLTDQVGDLSELVVKLSSLEQQLSRLDQRLDEVRKVRLVSRPKRPQSRLVPAGNDLKWWDKITIDTPTTSTTTTPMLSEADRLLLEAKIDSRLADERFFSRTVDQLDNQVQSLTRKVESLQETVQRSLGSSYTSSSLSTLETTGRNLESKVNEMSYDINKLKHEVNEIKFNIWSMKSQNNLH